MTKAAADERRIQRIDDPLGRLRGSRINGYEFAALRATVHLFVQGQRSDDLVVDVEQAQRGEYQACQRTASVGSTETCNLKPLGWASGMVRDSSKIVP